jgi:chromosome segregation ATPase
VDTIALFDQHREFHQDQVSVVAELRRRVSELEFELAQRQSLESEVARLSKVLAEREMKLAKYDESIVDAELRRNLAEETSRGLTAELDARVRELSTLKAHVDNVEAKYSATSSINTLMRANLSVAAAQNRIAEEA